jgi:RNA 3'-terminal phosphate cyclase (ATP)
LSQVSAPILIDGSYGEGGGALLRTALCMSALTQTPLRVDNVRGATSYPGLDSEDLMLIQALAASTSAETIGAERNSNSLSFLPTKRPVGINLELDSSLGSRGANVNVVMNALVPVLARTGMYSRVTAAGETYGHRSLSFDYFENVTLHALRRMGIYAFPEMEQAGFGRESRGLASIEIEPSVVQGIQWTDRGPLRAVQGVIVSSHLPAEIGERGASHLARLAQAIGLSCDIAVQEVRADRPGLHVSVWATYEKGCGGASSLGSKGVRVEAVAQAAFEELYSWLETPATLDPFVADQILLPAAFAEEGCSFAVSKLTERFITSAWVIKQFLPIHITVKGSVGKPGSITVKR